MADNGGDTDETRVRNTLQEAACTDRIAFGLHAGQTVPAAQGVMLRDVHFKQNLRTGMQGFSQQLPVRCGLDDCQPLDRATL